MSSESVARFYGGWERYNEQIVSVVEGMSADQLATRPAPDRWPIWATLGHTAGMRVYWLCGVLGEPGSELTPFGDPASGIGWEDDLDRPRSGAELVEAFQTTWQLIESCLQRWTIEDLDRTFTRSHDDRQYSRQAALIRLLSHDAYHCGEVSQTLGINGLPQIDLWPAESG
jgi:uncharacterized damage-inducible protein DinB